MENRPRVAIGDGVRLRPTGSGCEEAAISSRKSFGQQNQQQHRSGWGGKMTARQHYDGGGGWSSEQLEGSGEVEYPLFEIEVRL